MMIEIGPQLYQLLHEIMGIVLTLIALYGFYKIFNKLIDKS